MPAINRTKYTRTDRFNAISKETAKFNEDNDCGVKALAVAADVSYADAHKALADAGRQPKQGTNYIQLTAAAKALGFKLHAVNPDNYIADYPGVHKGLKNVTTHHPDRFSDVWMDEHNYMFFSRNHVGAVINGVNHDWTRGSAKRVEAIYAVIPKTAKVSDYLKGRSA